MNSTCFSSSVGAVIICLGILVPVPAGAVLLGPGDTAALPGTTVLAEPQLAGLVIEDELIPFTIAAGSGFGVITGIVQQRVVRSSVDGTLDFYWRVENNPRSGGAIGSFRIGGFIAPEYNANFRTDGVGDKAPDSAHRFAGASSSFVNFLFDVFSVDPNDGLLPGQSSYFMFLDTTATDYVKSASFDVTNMEQNPISDTFDAFTPGAVPEPSALGLLALGFVALGWGRRKTA